MPWPPGPPGPPEYDTESGGRRSGRTYRMIMSLPEGALVIVPNRRMREDLRAEIEQHRGLDFVVNTMVKAVTDYADVDGGLRGTNRPIRVDHSFWESPAISESTKQRLREFLLTHPYSNPTPDELGRGSFIGSPAPVEVHETMDLSTPVGMDAFVQNNLAAARAQPRRARPVQIYDGPEAEDL